VCGDHQVGRMHFTCMVWCLMRTAHNILFYMDIYDRKVAA
jgi:hypothetical protein